MPDIPLQSESEFTSDMVKAVENIAANVKLGSSEFSDSIGMLSKAIDGLKSSLIESINSLKSSANNSGPVSSSAAPRASQGRSASAQDPAVARAKEEEKKIKAETKALNIKTAQERAIFNAKKLQLQIESVNEGKTTRRKKADADIQQQTIEEVFENVGKGFGDVFAVTKEQVSAMTKSGKKGKKEKPFEMDMGALSDSSVKKEAGKGVDIAPQFIGDIMNASAAWNNVFANAAESASKWKDVFSIADESKPKQTQEFDPGTDFVDPIIRILEQTSEEMAAVVKAIEYSGGDSYDIKEEAKKEEVKKAEEQAPLVGPTKQGARKYQIEKEEDKTIKEGVGNFSVLFEAMFGKMGKTVENVIATTMSGINQSFSDKSPVFDKIKSMFGASAVDESSGGNTEGKPKEKDKKKSKKMARGGTFTPEFEYETMDAEGKEDKGIVHAVDEETALDKLNASGLNITKLNKTKRGLHTETEAGFPKIMENIGFMFDDFFSLFGGGSSGSSNGNNTSPKSDEGFPGGVNGDDFPDQKPTKYFAEGTKPKSGIGGIFEGIGSVFSSMFGGGKKKKKKKKSLLNNDENNWDTDTNYENKYKNYRANGGEIDDENTPFKPKGTDTVPAMLTPGEEVVKKSAAEKPENKQVIDAMNKSSGGKVGYFAGGTPGGGGRGIVGGLASLALGPVGQAFSVLTGSVKAASDAIGMFGSFVAKNNPAVMEQVNLAMNDLQGAIGRALVPAVQALLPVLRYMGDGVDFIMKMLMPAINPLVNAFKTLAMPLIEMETVVAQFLAPAFEIVAIAVEGFAIMLDPVIQLVSEVVESFTQLLDSFLGGIPITKFMRDGFEILGQIVKILVGVIVSTLGLFMTGMGVILQLAGYLVQGFGMLIEGVGKLISYIPGMGTLGAILTDAGTSVAAGGKAIVKSGEDLQKKGEDQRDRGIEKMKEGGQNIIGKFTDPNYKMKDNTRYKPGDVTGVGMKKGSSVGAAVREVQSTSISGVGDEIRKQALMAATGAKTQEESLAEIAKGLSKQNLADAVKAGVIAANADNKGGPPIVGGKNPMRRPQPLMAPV